MKRYQFINQQQQPSHTPVREVSHVIAELTEMLGVSKSGYYDWRDRPTSARTQHHRELAEQVHEVYEQCHGIYGSRKITAELKDRNIEICRNTVSTLMREKRLQCKAQRRKSFTVTTEIESRMVFRHESGMRGLVLSFCVASSESASD